MARESSTIVPPSGLQVNRQSSVPVHVQLTTQIRHLIEAGHLKPGVQLPTVRQLAGFLRINRNTAARALADLLRDGYLESQQGRGTFVVERPPTREGRAARSLEVLVEETLERARRLGFTHEELLVTVAARAPYAGMRPRPARVRALLVECNWEELTRYREELETALPVSVDRVLVEELPARMAQEPGFLSGYRVVVTTFFHIHEVKAAVPVEGPPVVALLSKANISTLLRLTELPPGATVGLVCTTRHRQPEPPPLAPVRRPLGHHARARVRRRSLVPGPHPRADPRRPLLRAGAARIRKTLPPDVELIVSDRTLDHGGLELLRDLLIRLEQLGDLDQGDTHRGWTTVLSDGNCSSCQATTRRRRAHRDVRGVGLDRLRERRTGPRPSAVGLRASACGGARRWRPPTRPRAWPRRVHGEPRVIRDRRRRHG